MYTKRQQLEFLKKQLEMERSSFIDHWRDLGDYILPRRTRFFLEDINKGDRRNNKIIDSTATLAVRTLKSGMMSGVTSPARPWFKLTTPDPDLADFPAAKNWLNIVETRMYSALLRSNVYQKLPTLYGDLGVFGTGAMSLFKDKKETVIGNSFPIGSYSIGVDSKGKPNIFTREFRMTVAQLITEFGAYKNGEPDWSVFSDYVKTEYQRGNYQTWIDVCHIIQPNPDYDPNSISNKRMAFKSCYYERGKGYIDNSSYERYLREGGFKQFPILAPRWDVSGEDTYATDCPGMTALGDIKALQLMHKRKAQAIEKKVNPPMVAPTAMANVKSTILPGDVTYFDESADRKFRQAHEINFNISELKEDIYEHQQRIKRSFYEDLFLMFAESDRRQITAREIDARGEEKLLAIGSVLEQLNQDALNPMIDIVFDSMVDNGMVPPAPPELQGIDLKVEYVSVMAQAQKLVGIGGVDRFTGFISNLAAIDPRALTKLNIDETINVYADLTSVPPKMIYPDEEAQAIRDQQAEAQQAAMQAEQMKAMTGSVKDLSGVKTDEPNLINQVLGIEQ